MANLKQTNNLHGINYEAETHDLAIKHSEDVWKSILLENSQSQIQDNSWNLHTYMEKMAKDCPGFTYRLAYDVEGVYNGVLWLYLS